MSGPWNDDGLSYYTFPDLQDEQRYVEETTPETEKSIKVFCCACNKVIDSLEFHVLKTLHYGWHVNENCLKNMEEWIIEEYKRRETIKWKP